MTNKTMPLVTLIGGGFSGLVTAYFLLKEGFSVELHEKKSELGGLISTRLGEYGLSETAANSLIWSAEIENLFRELKVEPVFMKEEAKRRYIFRNKIHQWPLTVIETIKLIGRLLFTHKGKNSFRPEEGQSLAQWGRRHLGPEATQYLLGPVMQGIYAGDIEKMSANLMLKAFFQNKKKKDSQPKKRYRGMLAPKKGMQALIEALAREIQLKGGRIHLSSDFQASQLSSMGLRLSPSLLPSESASGSESSLRQSQETSAPFVICTGLHQSGELIKEASPELSEAFLKAKQVSILTATVFYRRMDSPINGFGVLVPRDQACRVLGVLANSQIFDHRGDLYNETWIFGGAQDPSILNLNDQELKNLIYKERVKIIGSNRKEPDNAEMFLKPLDFEIAHLDFEIAHIEITRWPEALPHYTQDLEKALLVVAAENISETKGIYFVGNYLAGIGLTKILKRAQETVEKIKMAHIFEKL